MANGQNAGTIYSEVRIQLDKLQGDVRQVQGKMSEFGRSNETTAKNASKSWTSSFKNINLAGVAAFTGLGLAVRKAIQTFAGFEQSLANVQSVAGATPAEFELLEQAALSAGETTRFSASQAADALYNLASAGLDAAESAAALDGVLQLAGATGSDLARTSAIVTATLSQYGLEAAESARISNVFAAAIGNSQANMDKLGLAFRQVGPVASAMGISLEETTGALQALFDAGFQGEQAGTALRNALGALANETDPVVQKLESLGLSFENLNPATNDFASIIGTLSEAGLEAGEVIGAFGREVGPQMLTLLRAGEQGIRDYTDAVTDTTSAAEMYSTQNDTLQGSIDEMLSAVESASIGLVRQLAPAMRAGVEILTALIRGFNSAPGPVKLFVAAVGAMIPIVVGATVAVGALGSAFAVLLGPVGLVIGGLAAVAAGAAAIGGAVSSARVSYIEREFGALSETLGISTDRMDDLVRSASNLGTTDDQVARVVTELANLQERIGASNDEMDRFVETAGRLGATGQNVADVTEQVARLHTELNLSHHEIEAIGDSLERGQFGGYFGDAADQVLELSRNTGFTQRQIVEIGLANQHITGQYREQLESIEDALDLERQRSQQHGQMVELQRQMHEQAIEQQRAAREEQERIESERRQAAIAAEQMRREQITETIAVRRAAEQEQQDQIRLTQRLLQAGAISEEEAINRTIKANERLIETLAEQGYTGELTATQWTDAQGNIQETVTLGDQAMRRAIDTTNQLRESLQELSDERESDEEAAQRSEQLQEQINSLLDDYQSKIAAVGQEQMSARDTEIQRATAALENLGAEQDAIDQVTEAINRYHDALEDQTAADAATQRILDFRDQAVDAFFEASSLISEILKNSYDKQIEDLDRRHNAELDAIEERKNAAIEAAGVATETELEILNRRLEEAIAAGDTETANKLQDEITRTEIEKRFAEERAIAEEQQRKEQAQLQYEAELAQYRMRLLSTVGEVARGIAVAIRSAPFPFNLPAVGFATVNGALQVAAVRQAKPEPPSFATGGIVPGRSFSGDNVQANVNSGEMILNADQQRRLFEMIAGTAGGGAGGRVRPMVVQNIIDGRVISEVVTEYQESGNLRTEGIPR